MLWKHAVCLDQNGHVPLYESCAVDVSEAISGAEEIPLQFTRPAHHTIPPHHLREWMAFFLIPEDCDQRVLE